MNPLVPISQSQLVPVDYLIVAGMLAAMIGVGYAMGRKGKATGTADFFLGQRQIPWVAAIFAFVATEVSALTIISVPAVAFMENWEYAQFFIGSTVARFAIAYYFIPAFYQFNCTTIYEFLKHRFGAATQYTATVFFFLTRVFASGVRLMVGALAIAVLLNWPVLPSILMFTVVSITYISYGGIRSAIWTGVLQTSVYIVGGITAIAFMVAHIPGGWHGTLALASAAGKTRLWDMGPSGQGPHYIKQFLSDPNIVWIAILNGFFGSMAAFGTDHELMVRLLTVKTREKSQRAMTLTPLVSGLVLSIYLGIGTCLYSFFTSHSALPLPRKLDTIYPYFIGYAVPAGLRGFLMGTIMMASLDTPLASLSASFVTDIYRPLIRRGASELHYLRVSRYAVAVFACILAAVAYGFSFYQKFLWLAFKIGGVTFGSLLGVFLLGLWTKRVSNRANVIAMIVSACLNAALLIRSELGIYPLGWTWLVLIGTFLTFSISYVFGPMMEKGRPKPSVSVLP